MSNKNLNAKTPATKTRLARTRFSDGCTLTAGNIAELYDFTFDKFQVSTGISCFTACERSQLLSEGFVDSKLSVSRFLKCGRGCVVQRMSIEGFLKGSSMTGCAPISSGKAVVAEVPPSQEGNICSTVRPSRDCRTKNFVISDTLLSVRLF